MAPLTAWLPARPNQDFDLIIKIVGSAASGLMKDWTLIAQLLIRQGLSVMAQQGRLNGELGDFVLGIRIATRPFCSMGHGCDVLVYLSDTTLECWRFGLQPGSVLLWEPPSEPRLYPLLPEGVIAYAVPMQDICLQHGEGLRGKGLAALGVLLHLLGVPEESLHHLMEVLPAPRSFASGWDFARRGIKKHDVYSLPLPATEDGPSRMILTPEQTIMLGFAVSSCECRTMCDHELFHSPIHWMAKHTEMAGAMVSVLQSDSHPGVQAYRGLQGRVIALLRGDDSAIASCLNGFNAPRVFVAADIPDALRLLMAGHDLIRSGLSDGVGVLIEETVALRHQSVEIPFLVEMIRRRSVVIPYTVMSRQPDSVGAMVDQDGDHKANVGYVAWGAAQGVVRDAVALCRSFGLNVAGFYPKVVVPFPQEELEAFARIVDRVVLVESSQMQGYEERLRAACSFQPVVVRPVLTQSLTPMDIFLREGLGAL